MLERALRIQEAHYGPEHVGVAKTLVNLANAHGELGDARTKRDMLERALPIIEAHYGPEHVSVAITLRSLANAREAEGHNRGVLAVALVGVAAGLVLLWRGR